MRQLYIYIYSISAYCFFKFTGLLHKKNIGELLPVTKVLFVRLDKLGDMCITVPYLKELKSHYPNAELTVLCVGSNAQFLSDLQVYFDVKLYDRLIVWTPPWRQHKYRIFGLVDFFSLLKQVFKMRHEDYNVVIQPVLMGVETLLSLLIKSDRVFSCIDVDMPLSRKLAKHLDFAVERHGNRGFHLNDNVFETVRNFDRLRKYNIQQEISEFHEQRKTNSARQKNIVINLSAGNARRNLQYKYAHYILDHVLTHYSKAANVSLIGTFSEVGLSNKLSAEFCSINNLVGKTIFVDLFSLLESTDLLITPDTGTMHLASLLNVCMICIFGPGSVPFCRPVSKNCVIVKKELGCSGCMDFCFTDKIPPPCIEAIDPKTITVEIDRFMNPEFKS